MQVIIFIDILGLIIYMTYLMFNLFHLIIFIMKYMYVLLYKNMLYKEIGYKRFPRKIYYLY